MDTDETRMRHEPTAHSSVFLRVLGGAIFFPLCCFHLCFIRVHPWLFPAFLWY
jgi:hypothetical protein